MATLIETIGLKGNPFEHYTAETEPNIIDYAVRPPYLQAISDRVRGLSSFILFGDRGAGKSATRITVYKEIWKTASSGKESVRPPFVVNLTDYSSVQDAFRKGKMTERDLIVIVAFTVVEQTLVWLASLEESERDIYIDGLDKTERTLAFALIKGFYLTVPDMEREISTGETIKLLNGAWTTKSAIWASRRWDALSTIFAAVVSALSRAKLDADIDIATPAEALIRSLGGDTPNTPRAILSKLVDFVRSFGFSGVAVLVDKVDETPATSNSAENTTRLVHPLLSHIQLLEVDGFCWVLFLWSRVQDHFNSEKYSVRLDKLAHSDIKWDEKNLRAMVDERIKFFSGGTLEFKDIFVDPRIADSSFASMATIASNSPRELIKLMDTVFREHDARRDAPNLLDARSVETGLDKYVVDTIGGFFAEKPLEQVLRLGLKTFVNRDVQSAFKIGDQSARVKIRTWQDAGIIQQSGTQAPSEVGGQPAYRFEVADARVERIIARQLVDFVGDASSEADVQ